MKEQPGVNQINFLIDALKFGAQYKRSSIKKLTFLIDHVCSQKRMKELVHQYSSMNYGIHLLNSVFPAADNPEQFHSRRGVVRLDEHPIQVLGWQEYEEEIQKGVKTGLDRQYILMGFARQAEARGIDLEWHFHAEVPKPSTPSGLRAPGKG